VNLLLQLLANGLVNAAMFAVLAVGFGLVYRSGRVFHVAYGGAFVLAAFLFHSLVTVAGFGLWSSGAVTIALGALAGWAMEAGFYGPFFRRRTTPGAVMVASLGLGIVIENGLALIYGDEARTIPSPGLAESVALGPVRWSMIQLAQLLVCGVLLTILAGASRTRLFRVVRAMGENAELLQVHGWRLARYRATVFALSGGLVAVPACLVMVDVGLDVHMGMGYLLLAAVAVLAGGVMRMSGWMLGGLLLAMLQSIVVWRFSARWMDLVAFGLLVVILLSRREGLLGIRKRAEEI